MELHVSLVEGRPLGRQIYEQIRDAILGGRLGAGARLPATRQLAARLATSRNTVVWAYDLLVAEGFVENRTGSGATVREGVGTAREGRIRPRGPLTPTDVWANLDVPARRKPLEFDFRIGAPDAALFPRAVWRRLLARELRGLSRAPAEYADPSGSRRLREAIARHATISRSVACGAEDVMVVNGAQQAFDLIGRCLLRPGDVVAMEDPGYVMGRLAFAAQGARIAPVRVDEEGLVVDDLPRAARLVFVTPSHQFPTGAPMSLRRRHALLRWAADRGAAIIEDDYNGELRFDGRPLEPLQRLDGEGRVIFVGSFSKVLHPGLRLGYLVAPASLRAALRTARLVSDWHSPTPQQGAMAAFIESGQLATHIRRIRTLYGIRRRRLLQAVAGRLPQLSVLPSVAGLHIGALLPTDWPDATVLATAAAAAGVALNPWSDFSVREEGAGLSLGFGAIPTEAVEAGVSRLAEAIDRARSERN